MVFFSDAIFVVVAVGAKEKDTGRKKTKHTAVQNKNKKAWSMLSTKRWG